MKSRFLIPLLMMLTGRAFAFEPFTIKDIRVEGIQRTEAGTVFSYMPVKVGDTLDDEKAAATIKALFATGFFKDVRLEYENDVLIVQVQERPAIGQIEFKGMKEFSKDQLKDGFKQIGLTEGRTFDRAVLDKAEQEMKRQYLSRGKYAAEVKTTVTPLERNRVAVQFDVDEGESAKIRQINIVGASAYREKDLLSLLTLTPPNLLTWYTKNDQYSKQKLSGDLETLRSYYLNRGYLEFNIDSTQVQISPDKQDIYITINVSEGKRYTVSDIKVAGELTLGEKDLRKLIRLHSGEVFSREKLTESTKAISDRLGNDGYAFANVNAVPDLDKVNQRVAFTFFIDPGRKVYVRRIALAGNTKTRDEVIRREIRQSEGGWYAQDKINRTRERLDQLDYFKEVNIETPAVPGTTDQVDMNISVEEKSTGSIMAGVGFGSGEGLILSGSISQSNVLGSGNFLAAQVNTSKINKVYSLSYTNPYYTDDGVSLGFEGYVRDTDTSSLSTVTSYSTKSKGVNVNTGVPLNETDRINFGLGFDHTSLKLASTASQSYVDFVNAFGSTYSTFNGSVSWARNTLNNRVMPTTGIVQRASTEVGLPGGDLQYYKLNYQQQWYHPLSKDYTLLLNGEIGLANGLGGKPLPFFKNYYAGGITSVRGYKAGTLGPKDTNGDAIGGARRIVANAELFLPMPGVGQNKSIRLSAFFDAGEIVPAGTSFSGSALRYSTGLGLTWVSPVGPLRFSLGFPLNAKPDDKREVFQFQLGSVF
jgi:outer membrane protein insertion porin family